MIKYSYKARDKQGTSYENTILAESEEVAIKQLSEKGLWVIQIKKGKSGSTSLLNFELDEYLAELSNVG